MTLEWFDGPVVSQMPAAKLVVPKKAQPKITNLELEYAFGFRI